MIRRKQRRRCGAHCRRLAEVRGKEVRVKFVSLGGEVQPLPGIGKALDTSGNRGSGCARPRAASCSTNQRDPEKDARHIGPAVVDAGFDQGKHDSAREGDLDSSPVLRSHRCS